MGVRVFVTGGAGYIGSHMVRHLRLQGHEVTVFDNLSTGHRDAVPDCRFVNGDLREREHLESILRSGKFQVAMHFAANCYVGESMIDPEKYFSNNIHGTMNLLAAMRAAELGKLVFSSSCATYGEPRQDLMDENHPQNPVNPYGFSKLASERMMRDYVRAYGFDTISLRYFNAAGCHPDGDLGERHEPETHLIPLVLREALRVRAGGQRELTGLQVFGEDFDTPDGTCIRDYVHVSDLSSAHGLAMDRLLSRKEGRFEAFNLGTERGASVKEVIDVCRRSTGIDITYRKSPRRPGDPGRLVASSALARSELGWKPRHSLDDVVSSAWRWFAKQA